MKGYGFDETKVTTAMNNFGLGDAVNKKVLFMKSQGKKVDPLNVKYDVVGTKIRELFFKIYPCLMARTLREQAFGKKHGYVRSWTGPVRHLPELRWMAKNANGEVIGADKSLYSGEFAHLCNDATNSPIQTAEVYQAMPDVTSIMNMLVDMCLKSRIFNVVHDSFEMYIYKPERDFVYAFLTYIASISRQPYFDIPMHIDVEESDPDLGEVFREGREINIEKFDLHEEIEKFNEKFPSHQLSYDEIVKIVKKYIPLHGVLDGARYIGHGYKPRKSDGDLEVVA